MGYMTEKEYNSRMEKIQKKNENIERKRKLKEEENKYSFKFKKPSTSKLVLWMVFLMCIEVLIFCEYAMLVLNDASAMYVLIGIPAALIPTVLGYYWKSKAENTTGGITHEKVRYELEHQNDAAG